jgi:hypothetical protein
MDIYAAVYFCPNTSCQALLESPSHQWGQGVSCPSCGRAFTAPRDDVLHEHAGDAREGQVFRFRCPSCDARLECDSTRGGQPMTGQRVVCLSCRNIIEVPGGGMSVAGRLAPAPDPREALQQGAARRCSNPACAQLIPSRAERCPMCGEPQPLEVSPG